MCRHNEVALGFWGCSSCFEEQMFKPTAQEYEETAMMGYRDPNEDTWEGEQWDDFLKQFGPEAYVTARYLLAKLENESGEGDEI